MSNTKMLIDATHPEETRVVVQRNGRVEEFDFESAARKLLRGNIYLAKVTRVEPSLQAAFVDYGGNRHGFLAFSEIHPDYYQIPVADRQALIDEEAAAEAELEAAADRRAEAMARRQSPRAERAVDSDDNGADAAADGDSQPSSEDSEDGVAHIVDVEDDEDEVIEVVGGDGAEDGPADTIAINVAADDVISEPASAHISHSHDDDADDSDEDQDDHNDDGDEDDVDEASSLTADLPGIGDQPSMSFDGSSEGRSTSEFAEEAPARQRRRQRQYKIQEVIKRRQIILVQVVKEERGNKGAALTTYLSLAGRYTVLMPNTARGGGISRKITNPQDRKRLKAIAQELEVPEGMGLIIRTAGAARTKQEIKRDFEYLLRLWESVRDLTLQSTAPSLVYEEGDLVKRSIRDLYNKDVEEVVVAGDAGYHEAADFMRMLMPSHTKNVINYQDATPLFTKYGVERQLNAMFQPQVTLRSGGYIVINQTEALVAIDVNSGKSTREFSIEETALATNLEASDEIARQLKLRDLAGLIVIDFIDMEEKRNNRAVERRLKDALRFDRARIQLGRISHFGLMEMSRQRLRAGVLEGSTSQCPHCVGTGIIRSTESIALAVLRGLEDAITAGARAPLIATTTPTVALYILNSKRAYITEMEIRLGYAVTIVGSERVQGANFTIDRGAASPLAVRRPERAAVNMNWGFEGETDGDDNDPVGDGNAIEIIEDSDDGDSQDADGPRNRESGEEGDGSRRGGRRRRRGRGRNGRQNGRDDNRRGPSTSDTANAADDDQPFVEEIGGDGADDEVVEISSDAGDDDRQVTDDGRGEGRGDGRRRRRGRRGGRRGRERNGERGPRNQMSESGEPGDTTPTENSGDAADLAPEPSSNRDDRQAADQASGSDRRRRAPRIWDTDNATPPEPQAALPARSEPPTRAPAPIPPPVHQSPEPETINAAPVIRRHEMGSSEARIERVVVTPGDASSASDEPATPQRKGWWQRRFGGE